MTIVGSWNATTLRNPSENFDAGFTITREALS